MGSKENRARSPPCGRAAQAPIKQQEGSELLRRGLWES